RSRRAVARGRQGALRRCHLEAALLLAVEDPDVAFALCGRHEAAARSRSDQRLGQAETADLFEASHGRQPIIWARDVADNQVKGFIVENKTTPGFSVEKIQNKISLKVAKNGHITLKDAG